MYSPRAEVESAYPVVSGSRYPVGASYSRVSGATGASYSRVSGATYGAGISGATYGAGISSASVTRGAPQFVGEHRLGRQIVGREVEYVPVQRTHEIQLVERDFVVPVERIVQRHVPVPVERVVQRRVPVPRQVCQPRHGIRQGMVATRLLSHPDLEALSLCLWKVVGSGA